MTHILVVGAGSIGQRHIRNLVELGVRQISVVDSNIERALSIKKWADERDGESYTNRVMYGSNLSDAIYQKPDAAIVAVPTYLHSKIVIELLNSGINPIFIEKPVAHTLMAANNVSENVTRADSVVIGYSLRFHPALQIIKFLLPQIGIPLYARAEVGQYLPDWHPTEDYRNWYMAHEDKGGGALLDLSHEIDYMRWLFGDVDQSVNPIQGIVDATHPYLEITSDDIADFTCSLGKDETTASIHMDLLDRSYNRRLRVLGTEGTISWDWKEGMVILWTPTHKEGIPYPYNTDRNIQFIEEMKAFIHLVETGEMDERSCTMDEGLRVMEVVDTLKQQNGRI